MLKSILDKGDSFRKVEIYLSRDFLGTITWAQIASQLDVFQRKVNDEEENMTLVSLAGDNHAITQEIETSINTYLLRNKGAVSDFNLIKDIVERNSDALSAEVESQTAMPLYLGLIGTVAGIVLGLASLALQGQNLGDPSCIMALMIGVAFAMIASGTGVLFTSLGIWKSKQCSAVLEANKNKFYTWIQTELLPVLSNSTVSTLTLLERNLTHFNSTFSRTVAKLEGNLSKVGDVYGTQIELLEKLEKIDVLKMATANVKILETLTRSIGKLDNFARYLEETTDYLKAVRALNGKMDQHLERTRALETISDFYKKQMGEIELRGNAIKSVVTDVDEVIKKALADLKDHTQSGLEGLRVVYTRQQEVLARLADEQKDHIPDNLKKLDAMISLTPELMKMPEVVAALSRNSKVQAKATDELANLVRELVSTLPVAAGKGSVGTSFLSETCEGFRILYDRVSALYSTKKKRKIELTQNEKGCDTLPLQSSRSNEGTDNQRHSTPEIADVQFSEPLKIDGIPLTELNEMVNKYLSEPTEMVSVHSSEPAEITKARQTRLADAPLSKPVSKSKA